MVFHRSLSDSKSPQIFSFFLTNLIYAIVWMVSDHPSISKSSSPVKKPLRIGPSVPITVGITVKFMFRTFFRSLARSKFFFCFFVFFAFFDFLSLVGWNGKVCNWPCSLFIVSAFFTPLSVFQTSVSLWPSTGVWVRTSQLTSHEFFMILWSISAML